MDNMKHLCSIHEKCHVALFCERRLLTLDNAILDNDKNFIYRARIIKLFKVVRETRLQTHKFDFETWLSSFSSRWRSDSEKCIDIFLLPFDRFSATSTSSQNDSPLFGTLAGERREGGGVESVPYSPQSNILPYW